MSWYNEPGLSRLIPAGDAWGLGEVPPRKRPILGSNGVLLDDSNRERVFWNIDIGDEE